MNIKSSIDDYSNEFDKNSFLVAESDDGYMTLYDYVGSESDVVIPEGIEAVDGIVWSKDYKIEKLTFPKTLKTLDGFHFDFLKYLECVVFQECKLEKIPKQSFSDSSVRRVELLSHSIKEIDSMAFHGCKNLKEIFILDDVEKIGDSAFSKSGIEKITFPENLKELGECAFSRCHNLTSVVFNNNLEKISMQVFCETGLDNITFPKKLKQIGASAFFACDNLKFVEIPDSVEKIEKFAFGSCENLLGIRVGNNCKYIDETVFCSNYNKILYYPDDFKYADRISSNINSRSESGFNTYERITPPPKKEGCYVATCIYGSYDCPQVWTLRRFRDNILRKNFFGNLFIKLYYSISPTAVKWFGNCKWFHNIFKNPIEKLVLQLNKKGVKNTPYSDN